MNVKFPKQFMGFCLAVAMIIQSVVPAYATSEDLGANNGNAPVVEIVNPDELDKTTTVETIGDVNNNSSSDDKNGEQNGENGSATGSDEEGTDTTDEALGDDIIEENIIDEEIVVDEEQNHVIIVNDEEIQKAAQGEDFTLVGNTGDGSFTLNANGGVFINVEGTPETITLDELNGYIYKENSKSKVEKEGYVFTGWYADEECTQLVSDYSVFNVSYDTEQSLEVTTLYAGWTDDFWIVTFKSTDEGEFVFKEEWDYEAQAYVAAETGTEFKAYVPKNADKPIEWYLPYYVFNDGVVIPTDTEHKMFDGFVDSDGRKYTVYTFQNFYVHENIVLSATYVSRYTLTFDAGEGYFEPYDQSKYSEWNQEYYDRYNFNGTYSDDNKKATIELAENAYFGGGGYNEYFDTGVRRLSFCPPDPVAPSSDKKFAGWAFEDKIIVLDGKDYVYVKSDMIVTAVYSDIYTVTFDAGEGSFGSDNKLVYGEIFSGKTLNDSKYTYPAEPTTASGKAFAGWYKDPEFTQKVDKKTILNSKVSADTTYYARYSESATVTFYANGGTFKKTSDSTYALSIPQGTTVGVKAPAVVGADNSGFIGWFKDEALTDGPVNLNTFVVEESMNLYAAYEEDGFYTITFKSGMDGVKFKDEEGDVVIKVKKGVPFTYNSKVNSSPVIDFDATAKATGKAPTGYWVADNGKKYYFSYQGGINHTNARVIDSDYQGALPASGFIPTSDMTFTAEWNDQITIRYEGPKGTIFSNGLYIYAVNPYDKDVRMSFEDSQYYKAFDNSKPYVEFIAASGVIYNDIAAHVSSPYIFGATNLGYYYTLGYTKDGKQLGYYDPFTKDTTIYTKKITSSSSSNYGRVVFHAGDGKLRRYDNQYLDEYSMTISSYSATSWYGLGDTIPNDDTKAFAGWYTDEALTKPYTYIRRNGDSYSASFPSKSVTDLWAKYDTAVEITFDANGGYFVEEENVYEQDPSEETRAGYTEVKKTVPGTPAYISGYATRLRNDSNLVFGGWYLDEACTQKAKITTEGANVQYYTTKENVTLFAKWVKYKTPSTTSIKIEPGSLKLDIGARAKLTVTPDQTETGAEIKYNVRNYTCGKTNTFYRVPAIVDNDGNVIAQAEGTVYVYAQINGFTTEPIAITVSSKSAPQSMTLFAEESALRTGDVVEVNALVSPETLEKEVFTWTSSNTKVATVDSTGIKDSKITAVAAGKATITAKVGKLTKSMTITVVDGIVADKKSVYLTKADGAQETVTVTVKGHGEDEAVVDAVVYDAEGNVDSVVVVEKTESKFENGVGTSTFKVTPNAETENIGEGSIVFTTAKGYSETIRFTVSDRQKVADVAISGFDAPGVDENGFTLDADAEGIVINDQKITLATATRGASIKYYVQYNNVNSFANVAKENIATSYDAPVRITSDLEEGYVKISAYASKDTLNDSAVVSKVFRLDNEDAWRDVVDEDKDLFDDDFENVAGSGLVLGHIPSNITYKGEKIVFTEDELRVYYNGKRLVAGKDYRAAYANNLKAYSLPEGGMDAINALTAAQKKLLPKITITAIGNYQGTLIEYFSIAQAPITDAYVSSNEVITVLTNVKKINPTLVVRFDLPGGKASTLKAGTDYDVFFNKLDRESGAVDYDTEFTAAQVLAEIKAGRITDYKINFRGKGNFTGTFETAGAGVNAPKAPKMMLLTPEDVKEGMLQLGNAKLSKKIEPQKFDGSNLSVVVANKFTTGAVKILIGKQALTYVSAGAAAALTEDGYYYDIYDPSTAEGNEELNKNVGTNNYIVIRPTVIPETAVKADGTPVENKLVGEYKVFFNITGTAINVRNIITSAAFTGEKLGVYNTVSYVNEQGEPEEYDELVVDETLTKLSAAANKPAQVFTKVGKTETILTPDQYGMTVTGDNTNAGTVKLVFTGRADRGTTGTVTKTIKVAAKKVNANIAAVRFAEGVDAADVPFSKIGAKPAVVVTVADTELVEGKDYTVSYSGNTKAGATGKLSVKFIGNYSGSLNNVLSFKVGKAPFESSSFVVESVDKVYNAKAAKNYFKSAPALYENGKKLALKTDYVYETEPVYTYAEDYVVRDAEGNVSRYISAGTIIPDTEIVPAGAQIKVSFTAKPAAKSNYKALTDDAGNEIATCFETTYRIGALNIAGCTVKIKDQIYANDKEIIPSKDDFTITVKKGNPAVTKSDFEIISVTNNTKIGTATVTIRGNGNYCGTKKVTFKIVKGSVNK